MSLIIRLERNAKGYRRLLKNAWMQGPRNPRTEAYWYVSRRDEGYGNAADGCF